MARDPIGDAFAEQVSPEPVKPVASKQSGSSLLVVVLVCVLAFVAWNKYGGDVGPQPKPDDQKEQGEPSPASLDLKKHMLIVVRDKKTLNDDVEYTITMQDDEFWGWANQSLADVEVLEDDDDLAKAFLSSINEKPPLVALKNVETRRIVWVMPLPKGGTDSIRSKLK